MRIIDGNNLLHRVADRVGGGIHPVREVYNRFYSPPETTIIVWDGPYANKRRKEIFPEYKATRRPKEESKHQFFEIAKGVLRFTPVIQVEIPGWEADDIIGTMIDRWHKQYDLVVETNDGDYWQHKDKCFLPLVTKKWHHMSADEALLWKATVGEAKDNLKGMKGFGQAAWDRLTDDQKKELIDICESTGPIGPIKGRFTSCGLAHSVTSNSNFDAMRMCWRLNKWWPVPLEEIDKHTKVGKSNPQAAEIFLGNFLL